jgi:hypothetical protein
MTTDLGELTQEVQSIVRAIEDDAGGSLEPVDLGGAAVLLELPRVDDEE